MTQPDLFQPRGVVEIALANRSLFTDEFMAFLPDNLHIWDAFVREVRAVINKGFKHYSARTIIHVLRHHSALYEAGGEFKINNNTSPYLARLFDVVYPQYSGLFEYREVKKVTEDTSREF